MSQKRPRKLKIEKLLKLKESAATESRKYGRLFDTPEDAGQEYVKRLLEGKHQHSFVSQAVIDMARDLTGRKGNPGYEAHKAITYAIPTDPDEIHRGHQPFDVVNRRLFLEKAMNKLSEDERIVVLGFLEGHTFDEIADMMGFTAAWASHLYHRAVEKMKFIAKRK